MRVHTSLLFASMALASHGPVAAGRDPQLDRAVQVTLEALERQPVLIPDHPPYPDDQTP